MFYIFEFNNPQWVEYYSFFLHTNHIFLFGTAVGEMQTDEAFV